MALAVVSNLAIFVIQTNQDTRCELEGECDITELLEIINFIILFIYAAELVLRLYVERWKFFGRVYNYVDIVIVGCGLTEFGFMLAKAFAANEGKLQRLQALRAFRVLRLLRTAKLMRVIPPLASMVQSFAHVMSAMMWGLLMMALMLLVISVMAVEIVRGSDGLRTEQCVEAFSSVDSAMLFFFQTTITGESWGACEIPLIKEYWFLSFVFTGTFCMVQFGFMNLILSAIISVNRDAHDQDIDVRKAELVQEKARLSKALDGIFQRIDTDGIGLITCQQLLDAFEHDDRVNSILLLCGIDKPDLEQLFLLMDVDSNQTVDYSEFVNCISRALQQDIRMQLMTIKLQVAGIASEVKTVARLMNGNGSVSAPASPIGLVAPKRINSAAASSIFARSRRQSLSSAGSMGPLVGEWSRAGTTPPCLASHRDSSTSDGDPLLGAQKVRTCPALHQATAAASFDQRPTAHSGEDHRSSVAPGSNFEVILEHLSEGVSLQASDAASAWPQKSIAIMPEDPDPAPASLAGVRLLAAGGMLPRARQGDNPLQARHHARAGEALPQQCQADGPPQERSYGRGGGTRGLAPACLYGCSFHTCLPVPSSYSSVHATAMPHSARAAARPVGARQPPPAPEGAATDSASAPSSLTVSPNGSVFEQQSSPQADKSARAQAG